MKWGWTFCDPGSVPRVVLMTSASLSLQPGLNQGIPMLRSNHLQPGINLNPISFPSADLTLKVQYSPTPFPFYHIGDVIQSSLGFHYDSQIPYMSLDCVLRL